MTDRELTPLTEIVPDPHVIDRNMHDASPYDCNPAIDALVTGCPYDETPSSTMYHEGYIEEDEAVAYARTIFGPASAVKPAPRVQGALYTVVTKALDAAIADWQKRFPDITHREVVEITKFSPFTTTESRQSIIKAHGIRGTDHDQLKDQQRVHAAAARKTYQARLMGQHIVPGLLDIPPYEPQRTAIGCMTGCYSMIFKAIAEDCVETPNQIAMTSLHEYGGYQFDEDIMFQSLSTPLFREKTGQLVISRVLIGADFEDIAKRARHVKQRISGASVYATVGLRNFDPDLESGLHGVVLLGVTSDIVVFHNPYPRAHQRSATCTKDNLDNCGAFDLVPKSEFIDRWSASLHDARLVIARPAPPSVGSS